MARKKIACALCEGEFIPEKGQLDGQWAVAWNQGSRGKLCPPCHNAAKKLKAVAKEDLPLGVLPFGSDILEASATVNKSDWNRRRASESWRAWVEDNHPEWL